MSNAPATRHRAAGRTSAGVPRLLIGAGLAGCLLAGCGSNTAGQAWPAAAPTGPTPSPTASAPPVAPSAPLSPETGTAPIPPADPPAGPAPGPAGSIEQNRLPWPAPDPAEATRLQTSVDSGSEPWLLDPTEVALSYATAVHGWNAPQAQLRPDGRTVEVTDGGRKMVLSLVQPARTGVGGIWLVTAEAPGG